MREDRQPALRPPPRDLSDSAPVINPCDLCVLLPRKHSGLAVKIPPNRALARPARSVKSAVNPSASSITPNPRRSTCPPLDAAVLVSLAWNAEPKPLFPLLPPVISAPRKIRRQSTPFRLDRLHDFLSHP